MERLTPIQFIKKYHGYVAWVLLLLALIGGYVFYDKYVSANERFSGLTSILKAQSDSTRFFVSKSKTLEAEKNSAISDKAGIQAFLDTKSKEALQLKNQLSDANIKLSNLLSASTINANVGVNESKPPIIVSLHDTVDKGIHEITFKRDMQWYSIGGLVTPKDIQLSIIEFPIKLSAVVGFKRTTPFNLLHPFKKRLVPVIDVSADNPYCKINDVSNITVTKDKSILSKPLLHLGVGAVIGAIAFRELQLLLTKP